MNEILHNNEQENQNKKTDLNDSEKNFLQIIEKNFPEDKKTLTQQRQELLQKHNDIQENLKPFINKIMLCYDGISITKNDIRQYLFNTINNILSEDMYKNTLLLKKELLQDKYLYIFRNKIIDNINKDKAVKLEDKAVKLEDKAVKLEDKAVKLRSKLEERYITIEPKYKHKNPKEFNDFKNQAKFEEILQKLPQEKHEIYFSYRFVAEKIAKEARNNKTISEEHVAFIEQFNKLDKQLNLDSQIDISGIKIEKKSDEPITTINDIIDKKNIGETLVAHNESIQSFVKESNDIISDEDKEQLFPIENIKSKVIQRYPDKIEKNLDDLLTKNNLTSYKEQFNPDGSLKDDKNITEEDKENLEKISETMNDNITDLAEEEQDRMMQETNEIIKTKAIEALVKNIGQYFQVTNSQEGNLAEKVSIDIENGVSFDQNMLTLSTNMDGKDIGFYYDMQNGEVRADDFIHYDGENETKEDGVFFVNKDQDRKWREQLPIKMETLDQILADSTSKTKNNIESSLEESDEPQEYRENLSENTEISYQQKSSVGDIVIEHTMEKNTAIQQFHEFATAYIPTKDSYGRQKEKHEYNLYKIIDTTFDRYTADEIKQRNNLFQRFQNKINEDRPSFNDELISSLFDEETAKLQQKGEYDLEKWPNIYQFFQGISHENGNIIKEQVIDLTFFEKIVNELEKEEGNTKELTWKSEKYERLRNNFEESKTKEEADNNLHLEDPTLRGNSI